MPSRSPPVLPPGEAQAQAGAQSGVKRILDRGKLIVGTRSTTIGFGFKDAKGELVGFDIDLAKAIAKGLLGDEKKIEFEVFPGGAERVPALTSGRVDIVISQFSVFEAGPKFWISHCPTATRIFRPSSRRAPPTSRTRT